MFHIIRGRVCPLSPIKCFFSTDLLAKNVMVGIQMDLTPEPACTLTHRYEHTHIFVFLAHHKLCTKNIIHQIWSLITVQSVWQNHAALGFLSEVRLKVLITSTTWLQRICSKQLWNQMVSRVLPMTNCRCDVNSNVQLRQKLLKFSSSGHTPHRRWLAASNQYKR